MAMVVYWKFYPFQCSVILPTKTSITTKTRMNLHDSLYTFTSLNMYTWFAITKLLVENDEFTINIVIIFSFYMAWLNYTIQFDQIQTHDLENNLLCEIKCCWYKHDSVVFKKKCDNRIGPHFQ